MLKKLLIAFGLLVLLVAVLGATMSKEYEVVRTVTIDAPPAKVHQLVGHLDRWPEWAPWHEDDPTIKTTFGEKTTGVGASQTWTSKDGDGRLTFTACDPQTGVAYDMVFVDGETEMPARGEMRYERVGDKTKVTWRMTGTMDVPIIGGYFALMSDAMIGPMFERGLENLEAKVEGR